MEKHDEPALAMDESGLSLEQMLGQLLVAGFPGTSVTPEIVELIERQHVGNIILFARNVGTPEQLLALTTDLQQAARKAGHRYPLLISIDQENGVVRRLKEGTTGFPGSMALGAAGSEELVHAVALATGRELRALGVNMNLAPVLDVNNNPANPVIGVRSFGEDPRQVAHFGVAAMRGYQDAGVLSCVKHFPGHGDTAVDSHLGLPIIPHSRERLEAVELVPFRAAVEAGADAVMSAHVALPQLTGQEGVPATISPAVIQGLLRDALSYDGVVASDCLEMQAIADTVGTERGAVLALLAGIDLVYVSHRYDRQAGALAAMLAAVRSGELPEQRVRQALGRVLRLKARHLSWDDLPGPEVPEWVGGPEHEQLAEQAYEMSVTLVRDDVHLLPLRLPEDARVLLLYPRSERLTGAEEDNRYPEGFPAESVRRRHRNVDAAPVSPSPDAEEREALLQRAAQADVIVALTMNANLFEQQAALMRGLVRTGRPVVGIAVRTPYDLLAFPELPTYLATYEYTPPALEAAMRVIFGEIEPVGRLPVSLPGMSQTSL